MAFMDAKQSDPTIELEDTTESPEVAHLEDGKEGAMEIEYGSLVAHVISEFTRAKTARSSKEDGWLEMYQNYRGLYGPNTQFTDKEKSRAFIKITKTKVLASYAQIIDVMFAGGKFPIGIEDRNYPRNVAGEVNYDPSQLTKEKVKEKTGVDYDVPRKYSRPDIEKDLGIYADILQPVHDQLNKGTGDSPEALMWEPDKIAALKMERKIHDQLAETGASKHLRKLAFEQSLFGTGILKGPFAFDKEYPKWSDGEYTPEFDTIPKVEARSIWSIYPDPEALNMDEATYLVDRHRMSKTQLRKLNSRPMFRKESIRTAIDYGPSYVPEHWEVAMEQNATTGASTRYEVLEYWGVVDREILEDADLDIPEEFDDEDELQVNIWICNGQILRLVMNPFTPTRIPYHAVPYEVDPYSFWGVGTAENMLDTQLLMNGFMRMAVDNAALSGNLLIEIDETNLVPGQDMSVYPGKVFRRQAGAPGQAIFGTKFPNVSNELLQMFDKARQLADESTGMPSYSHGQTGVTGVGRTAAGMSMLMGAAATNIKAVVRNLDDYLLMPLGKAMFAFNMQFHYDEEFAQGDLEVKSRGTESLMRNEIRSQRLLQFMQMTQNQILAPFVKYDYILRELAASMDLDEEKILNDPREAKIQAKMMAEVQAQMPQPPAGAAPQQGGPEGGPPSPDAATNNGTAPEPGSPGYSGGGGGDNGGVPPQQQGAAPQQPPMAPQG
jgi:hypothetical protein